MTVMINKKIILLMRPIYGITIAMVSTALLLSGCQETPETEATNEPETTETEKK